VTRGARIGAASAGLLLGAFVLVALVGSFHGSATALDAAPLEPPSADHPFGTDALGRDLLARTGQGARTSASIALVAVGASLVVAVPLGIAAGWRAGGWFDAVAMRVVETTQVVPPLILVLLLLGAAGLTAWGRVRNAAFTPGHVTSLGDEAPERGAQVLDERG